MPLAAGSKLGPYEILAPLGAGGMGEVYRARDTRLGREVAVKVLPAAFSADADRLRRFEQEARAASALNHPNILTIYDVGTHDSAPYVVSELLEGETLRERLAGAALPARKAVDYGVQIAEGLAAAHEKGIVHRDLKPENLFVTKDGRVKILDFGLAKLTRPEVDGPLTEAPTAAAATEPGVVMGTVGYMSPEQVRGQAADHRSDLFAFGAVLYEMLAGKRAFQGASAADTMSAILKEEPVFSPTPADSSPGLEHIVRRCLEKSPGERFQSARDLAFALRETSSGSAAVASVVSPVTRSRPILWFAAVGVVVFLAVLLALNAGGIRELLFAGGPPAPIRSLAVLPLENLSRDSGEEYFADGMTEALISNLARIRALRVISRTSVMRYKGTRKAVPEIARELNVDGIVEGSVLRAGDRVRITAQLVHASSDRHLWAEDYERDARDVLTLQSEVARAIAQQVRAAITPQEEAVFAKAARIDPEAHRLYLLGRFHWNKRSREGFQEALTYFQQSIERDPTYAPAYAGLADTYTVLQSHRFLEPREAGRLAKAAAVKALELDDTLAEAHTSLASVYWDELDWARAATEFQRAIQLNPGYATARQWYGEYLSNRKRHDEAIEQLRTAEKLDPFSRIVRSSLGRRLYFARRYDEATQQLNEALKEEPRFATAHLYLASVLLQKRMLREAIVSLERAKSLSESNHSLAAVGHAYAVAGRRGDALEILQDLRTRSARTYVSPLDFAVLYTGLGDFDHALESLEKAVLERSGNIGDISVDPILDPLRSDPRFADLLRRIGLPP